MQYIIFALLFIYIANWNKVNTLVTSYRTKRTRGKSVLRMQDKDLIELIYVRTKIRVTHIYLVPSEKLFAYGGGVAKKPLLFLSTAAYETFSGDALEWLLLHEMGHTVLYHSLGISIVQLFYLALGFVLLSMIPIVPLSILVSFFLGTILAIMAIQTNKEFDFQANSYAVKHMHNPIGMKKGALLLMKQAQDQGIYKDTLAMRLFYPWNYGLWHETIQAAEKEIKKRKFLISNS